MHWKRSDRSSTSCGLETPTLVRFLRHLVHATEARVRRREVAEVDWESMEEEDAR
jgi:hypothetical protein